MSTEFVAEAELAEAAAQAHHLEKALLVTRIERLTAIIREHDIPLPEDDPRLGASDGEHLAACRDVVTAAYDLLAKLGVLEDLVGAGVELLDERSWR